MKVVAKPIEVIFVMDTKGIITPLRLKIVKFYELTYRNSRWGITNVMFNIELIILLRIN